MGPLEPEVDSDPCSASSHTLSAKSFWTSLLNASSYDVTEFHTRVEVIDETSEAALPVEFLAHVKSLWAAFVLGHL